MTLLHYCPAQVLST